MHDEPNSRARDVGAHASTSLAKARRTKATAACCTFAGPLQSLNARDRLAALGVEWRGALAKAPQDLKDCWASPGRALGPRPLLWLVVLVSIYPACIYLQISFISLQREGLLLDIGFPADGAQRVLGKLQQPLPCQHGAKALQMQEDCSAVQQQQQQQLSTASKRAGQQ